MPGRTKRIKTNETRKSNLGKQSSPSITCLPDDCLLLIFQKLNLRNRIVMERGKPYILTHIFVINIAVMFLYYILQSVKNGKRSV